jgi:hypothetical protein
VRESVVSAKPLLVYGLARNRRSPKRPARAAAKRRPPRRGPLRCAERLGRRLGERIERRSMSSVEREQRKARREWSHQQDEDRKL